MNHVTHPLSSADINMFSPEIGKFCYIKKYRCRFHFGTKFLISFTPFEFLKIVLISIVTILIMSGKMVTLGFLKIKIFWKRGYGVIISFHNITNKILLRDLIVDVVMWPKFGNSCISKRKVIKKLNFIRIWPEKLLILRDGLGSSSITCSWY